MEINKLYQEGNKLIRYFFANNMFVKDHLDDVFYAYSSRSKTGCSKHSFCFGNWCSVNTSAKDRAAWSFQTLQKVFGFPRDRRELFAQAVDGDGNEWRRITQLNSSALLAFLTFGCLKKDVAVRIPLPGAGDQEFSDVYFEVKNEFPATYKKNSKSNVDVVLVNEKSVVFLESKFTEYLEGCTSTESMSYEQYGDIYKEIWPDDIVKLGSVKGVLRRDGGDLVLESRGKTHYWQGIKQMISHAVGLTGKIGVNRTDLRNLLNGRQKYLGEIVFDFGECDSESTAHIKAKDRLADYREIHSALVPFLRQLVGPSTIVLPHLLTYQETFRKDIILSSVARFYNFKI